MTLPERRSFAGPWKPAVALICFSTIWFAARAAGQEQTESTTLPLVQVDSLRRNDNAASIISDNNISTFRSIGAAGYKNAFGPLSLALNELFVSTVVQTDRKRITDEQNLDLFLRHRLADRLQAAFRLSSLIVTDNQNLGITNVTANAAYGGVEIMPLQSLTIAPLLGARAEEQDGQRDHGLSGILDIKSDNLMYDGYATDITGKFEYDNLSPRTLDTRYLSLAADKYFFEQTRNYIQFRYTRNKRDFYSPADAVIQSDFGVSNNIETRAEDAYLLTDTLDYNIGANVLFHMYGNVFTRTIDRETRYKYYAGNPDPGANTSTQETRFEGAAELRTLLSQTLRTSLQVAYQERDEKHEVIPDDSLSSIQYSQYSDQEANRNNHSRRTWLSSTTALTLSESHVISLTGSVSLLRYDTPTLANDDDRDELAYIISLSSYSRFGRHFAARLSIDANLNHLVYLGSTRSADNTWNRIFRLSPRLEYTPSRAVTTVNTFEVLANYTSYDFEYPSSPIRSFVFRQFNFLDSTAVDFTRRFGCDLFVFLRLYERGDFRWDSFSERPLTYYDERTYIIAPRYRLKESLLFSVGIRYFDQSRYAYSGSDRILDQQIRSIGPVTTVDWTVTNRTSFLLKGWYENQKQTGTPNRGIVTMTMSLVVHL